jgi:hypothetical protein
LAAGKIVSPNALWPLLCDGRKKFLNRVPREILDAEPKKNWCRAEDAAAEPMMN